MTAPNGAPGRAAAVPGLVEPMYFGPGGSLFGVFHPAERPRSRTVGIVLGYPAGHEHLRVQRTFRNIAAALARHGFPVVRFDFSGAGDSSGDGALMSVAAWQDDLAYAIDEVGKRGQVKRFALIGLRLGATIAWQVSLRRTDLDLLVMWEPVVDGGRYVRELRRLEASWLADPARSGTVDARMAPGQLLGFPFPPRFEQELATLDLAAGLLPASAHVIALYDAVPCIDEAPWRERLVAKYGAPSSAVLPSGAGWNEPAAIHTAVYSQAALQTLPAMFDKVIV